MMEDEWRHGKFKARRLALCRFEDAWANGSVTMDRYVHDGSPLHARIPAWGKEAVDSVLPGASDVPGAKACCARSLLFAESMGADGIGCLGPAVAAAYVLSLADGPSRNTVCWRLRHVRALLARTASDGAILTAATWSASTVIVKKAGLCSPLPADRVPACGPQGPCAAPAHGVVRLSLHLVQELLPRRGYAYATVKIVENALVFARIIIDTSPNRVSTLR